MRVQPFEPASLIGAVDPVEGTALVAGETIWMCRDAKVGYHASTITFLVQANGGRCVACRRSHEFEQITLPVPRRPIRWNQSGQRLLAAPVAIGPRTSATWLGSVVRAVRRVEQSPTGAFLIGFEPAPVAAADFSLVILPPSVPQWTRVGIDLASYCGRRLRVHGTIHDHPWWGRVMVVTQPSDIVVLDRSEREVLRWQSVDADLERLEPD